MSMVYPVTLCGSFLKYIDTSMVESSILIMSTD